MQINKYIIACHATFHEYAYRNGNTAECMRIENLLKKHPDVLKACKQHNYSEVYCGGEEFDEF